MIECRHMLVCHHKICPPMLLHLSMACFLTLIAEVETCWCYACALIPQAVTELKRAILFTNTFVDKIDIHSTLFKEIHNSF